MSLKIQEGLHIIVADSKEMKVQATKNVQVNEIILHHMKKRFLNLRIIDTLKLEMTSKSSI